MTLNDISLPTVSYLSTLTTSRINYNFNTKMFLNALLQYSTDIHQLSSNIRFNVIHRPLSDFFFVYNEHRDEVGREGVGIDYAEPLVPSQAVRHLWGPRREDTARAKDAQDLAGSRGRIRHEHEPLPAEDDVERRVRDGDPLEVEHLRADVRQLALEDGVRIQTSAFLCKGSETETSYLYLNLYLLYLYLYLYL